MSTRSRGRTHLNIFIPSSVLCPPPLPSNELRNYIGRGSLTPLSPPPPPISLTSRLVWALSFYFAWSSNRRWTHLNRGDLLGRIPRNTSDRGVAHKKWSFNYVELDGVWLMGRWASDDDDDDTRCWWQSKQSTCELIEPRWRGRTEE